LTCQILLAAITVSTGEANGENLQPVPGLMALDFQTRKNAILLACNMTTDLIGLPCQMKVQLIQSN
jgi:hypothetical protein